MSFKSMVKSFVSGTAASVNGGIDAVSEKIEGITKGIDKTEIASIRDDLQEISRKLVTSDPEQAIQCASLVHRLSVQIGDASVMVVGKYENMPSSGGGQAQTGFGSFDVA